MINSNNALELAIDTTVQLRGITYVVKIAPHNSGCEYCDLDCGRNPNVECTDDDIIESRGLCAADCRDDDNDIIFASTAVPYITVPPVPQLTPSIPNAIGIVILGDISFLENPHKAIINSIVEIVVCKSNDAAGEYGESRLFGDNPVESYLVPSEYKFPIEFTGETPMIFTPLNNDITTIEPLDPDYFDDVFETCYGTLRTRRCFDTDLGRGVICYLDNNKVGEVYDNFNWQSDDVDMTDSLGIIPEIEDWMERNNIF